MLDLGLDVLFKGTNMLRLLQGLWVAVKISTGHAPITGSGMPCDDEIMSDIKFVGIIPARYASTRFPGKPLADIFGKPMVQHVYERASQVLETVVVATDDRRIYDAVEAFGGRVVMTSENHKTGTDRCYEALTKLTEHYTFSHLRIFP